MDRTQRKGGRPPLTLPVRATIVGMNDKPALTDCPAVFVGREIDVPDTVPDICFNFVPCLSTIVAHRHRATPADCNRTVGIRELDILEIVRCRTTRHLPRCTSIRRVQNRTVPSNRPCLCGGRELDACQIIFGAAIHQLPVVATVFGTRDKTDIRHGDPVVIICEMDAVNRISDVSVNQGDTAVLTFPVDTTRHRMKDRTITANDPTLIVADEKDLFIIIDHPIAFTFKTVALFSPRFTAVFGMKNSIVRTDNPTL